MPGYRTVFLTSPTRSVMRDPSPYAGKTVRLRADAAELGGHDVEVVDWYERTNGGSSWRSSIDDDPRAQGYSVRRGLGGLPDDDEVLFGRVDGMGQLVHLTEIEGATAPHQTRTGPALPDLRAVGQDCPACGGPIQETDLVAVMPLGPGSDPQARANARVGLPFECVHIAVHWPCATGDESYSAGAEV